MLDYGGEGNSEEFNKKIEYHYPSIATKPIHEDDMLTPIFNITGKVRGTLGLAMQPSLTN